MTCAYRVDPERELILFRPTGRFDESKFIALCQAGYRDPQRKRTFAHVWDTRAIDELVMDASVIAMYQEFLSENEREATVGKVAIITSRAITRTFASMLIQVSKRHPGTFQLFDSADTAAEWVGVPVEVISNASDRQWIEL